MSVLDRARAATAVSLLCLASLCSATGFAENTHAPKVATPAAAPISTPKQQPTIEQIDDMPAGNSFACQDSSRMVLGFANAADGVDALVSVHGQTFRLPSLPNEAGVAEINWSDGLNSLTWSTGVHLMWMSGSTHLMCGRSHHH
ncbi:MAG: hypothetical protein ABMA14_02255 [Hyphomonadaceae bacterium]